MLFLNIHHYLLRFYHFSVCALGCKFGVKQQVEIGSLNCILMLVIHPWSSLLLNIDFHWLAFISHVTWMRPPLYPRHIINSEIVERNYFVFELLTKKRKNNRKLRKSDVVHFLSHHTHRFFLGQRCVKWSVKWVHLTSLQWIIHIILHWGSRASCLSSGNPSSSYTHLCSSHSNVRCTPEFICSISLREIIPRVSLKLLEATHRSCLISVWQIVSHHKLPKTDVKPVQTFFCSLFCPILQIIYSSRGCMSVMVIELNVLWLAFTWITSKTPLLK